MVESRSMTDIFFLVFIVAMWAAMSGVGGDAVNRGNIYRILGPMNDNGKICGVDDPVKNLPRLYYVSTSGLGVCVEQCPGVDAVEDIVKGPVETNYYCIDYLEDYFRTGVYAVKKQQYLASYCVTPQTSGGFDITKNCNCMLKYASTAVFRRCVLSNQALYAKFVNQDTADYFKIFMQDVMTARSVIFGFGFAVAVIASFVFIYLLRFESVAGYITWLCIFGFGGLQAITVILAYNTTKIWAAENPRSHSDNQLLALQAFAAIMMLISGLYMCLMIFSCRSVNMAVKCLSLASASIEEMPFVLLSPLIQVCSFVIFLVPWVFYVFNVASLGTWEASYSPNPNGGSLIPTGKKWVPENGDSMGGKLWFLFFCLLWTMNFIASYGQTVIALAVSKWYFTDQIHRVVEISNSTLISAYVTVARYHLGTVAIGSLLIALVQFARGVGLYLQKHTSRAFRANPVVKIACCCISCCLACMECWMKFISKNAYIQTAIHGTSFLASSKNAFYLIARNILRIGAVLTISHLAILAGKLFVMAFATATSYYYFTGGYSDKLHDFVAPTILVMIISWMTASMFFDVLQMAFDSLLMCYVSDDEANNGEPIFAAPKMRDFVKEKGGLSERKARAYADTEPSGGCCSCCCCCGSSSCTCSSCCCRRGTAAKKEVEGVGDMERERGDYIDVSAEAEMSVVAHDDEDVEYEEVEVEVDEDEEEEEV